MKLCHFELFGFVIRPTGTSPVQLIDVDRKFVFSLIVWLVEVGRQDDVKVDDSVFRHEFQNKVDFGCRDHQRHNQIDTEHVKDL